MSRKGRLSAAFVPALGATLALWPPAAGAEATRVQYDETHEFRGFTDTEPAYSFTCQIRVAYDWDPGSGSAAIWTESRGDPECQDWSNIGIIRANYVDTDGDPAEASATGRGGWASLGLHDVGSDLVTTHWVSYSHANTTSPQYKLPPGTK